jgi:hypothetical protein
MNKTCGHAITPIFDDDRNSLKNRHYLHLNMSDHLRIFHCKFVTGGARSKAGNMLGFHIIFQSFKITIATELLESSHLFALRSAT